MPIAPLNRPLCYSVLAAKSSLIALLSLVALFLVVSAGCNAKIERTRPVDDPASVIILINSRPEPKGSGENSSMALGKRYAELRDIPPGNIFSVSTSWEEEISFEDFEREIRAPLRERIEELNLLAPINYIVPIYGIPSRLKNLPIPPPPEYTQRGFSLDQFLASMNSGSNRYWIENPYRTLSAAEHRVPFRAFEAPWKMYLVSRLDGPSAVDVQGLIERTLKAERELKPQDGTGYFDWRDLGEDCGEYCDADRTVRRLFERCTERGFRCELNNQKLTGSMLKNAPETLWAWGWYSGNSISGEYRFVPGAVGAQLTSFTANSIRSPLPGAWVPRWIEAGITATWGATAEPYTTGYASGEIVIQRLWEGYSFGEAAYMGTPNLNWMMVFVGDPLYRPQSFRMSDTTPAEISDLRHVPHPLDENRTVVTFRTSEPGDTVVIWGEGNAVGGERAVEPTLTESHSISIGPLRRGIRYTVQARSRDRAGNEAVSPNLTFGW